ncbi:MAG: esterase/lipase family protein [Coraliomargaritaceae bacterium]
MNIVLVHGIWDTGRIFRKLGTHLTAQGHQCYAPNLEPANAANGLVDLAEKLRIHIDSQINPDENFALIGFSMGSLVSRHYLQCLGGTQKTTHFFSISGPNNGTLTAHFWPGKGSRDMRFQSAFLKNLNKHNGEFDQVEIHNYRTPFDLMIIPSRSTNWSHGEEHIIPALTHDRMLTHPRLHNHIGTILQNGKTVPQTPE